MHYMVRDESLVQTSLTNHQDLTKKQDQILIKQLFFSIKTLLKPKFQNNCFSLLNITET